MREKSLSFLVSVFSFFFFCIDSCFLLLVLLFNLMKIDDNCLLN